MSRCNKHVAKRSIRLCMNRSGHGRLELNKGGKRANPNPGLSQNRITGAENAARTAMGKVRARSGRWRDRAWVIWIGFFARSERAIRLKGRRTFGQSREIGG